MHRGTTQLRFVTRFFTMKNTAYFYQEHKENTSCTKFSMKSPRYFYQEHNRNTLLPVCTRCNRLFTGSHRFVHKHSPFCTRLFTILYKSYDNCSQSCAPTMHMYPNVNNSWDVLQKISSVHLFAHACRKANQMFIEVRMISNYFGVFRLKFLICYK